MANAKQRRTIEKAIKAAFKKLFPVEAQLTLPVVPALPERQTITQKVMAFFEQPLVLGPATVIAGIIGVFIWSPILIVCGCCFVVGLRQSGILLGQSRKTQTICYLIWIITVGWGLFAVNRLITKEAHAYVAGIVESIASRIPKQQPVSPIVPAPPAPIIQQPKAERPLIAVGQTSVEHYPEKQETRFHIAIENTTGAPTKIEVSFSGTINDAPIPWITTDMPRAPILAAGHSSHTLNLYYRARSDAEDKAVWDGTAKFDITVLIKYEHRVYRYVGRFNWRTNSLSVIESG